MSNTSRKYQSRPPTIHEMSVAIQLLSNFFLEIAPDTLLTVQYGTDSNLDPQLLYKPMNMYPRVLDNFLKKSIEQRIFVPGWSDVLIELPPNRINITLCHEGDIHVEGDDMEVVNRFLSFGYFEKLDFTEYWETKVTPRNEPSK